MITQESINIPQGRSQLHIKRVYGDKSGAPVLMVHGAIENGRIFYTDHNRGLAPFLAEHGFDVFVLDLAGRGESLPLISRGNNHSQTDTICSDLRAFVEKVVELKGRVAQHWVGHSWGGVLMIAYLLRQLPHSDLVASQANFGSKRFIGTRGWRKILTIDLFWNVVCRALCLIFGYLPAKQLRFGADNETSLAHRQSVDWVCSAHWVDSLDGFDYHKAAKSVILPPTLHIAAINDKILGNPSDVKRLIGETQYHEHDFKLLSKAKGYHEDYDHISMLTSKNAPADHFVLVSDWFKRFNAVV